MTDTNTKNKIMIEIEVMKNLVDQAINSYNKIDPVVLSYIRDNIMNLVGIVEEASAWFKELEKSQGEEEKCSKQEQDDEELKSRIQRMRDNIYELMRYSTLENLCKRYDLHPYPESPTVSPATLLQDLIEDNTWMMEKMKNRIKHEEKPEETQDKCSEFSDRYSERRNSQIDIEAKIIRMKNDIECLIDEHGNIDPFALTRIQYKVYSLFNEVVWPPIFNRKSQSKPEETQDKEQENPFDPPFSKEDIEAARESIVYKAKNGNLEACKYILECSKQGEDEGVLFDW